MYDIMLTRKLKEALTLYKTFSFKLKKLLKNTRIFNTVYFISICLLLSLIASSVFMAVGKSNVQPSAKPVVAQNSVEVVSSNASSVAEKPQKLKYYIKQGKKKILVDKTEKKTCYLTFDDGPSENTLEILSILNKYNAKATFFVVGTSKTEYLKNIKESGNAIGVHCYNHDYGKLYKSTENYIKDFNKANRLIEKETGEKTKIFRFPGGSSNTVSRKYNYGIMTRLSKKMNKLGYEYFDWNIDSEDATSDNKPVKQILKNIKNESVYKTSNGKYRFKKDICILMHDTNAKKSTVKALPHIIKYLSENGYEFEVLTKKSPEFHHGINN